MTSDPVIVDKQVLISSISLLLNDVLFVTCNSVTEIVTEIVTKQINYNII